MPGPDQKHPGKPFFRLGIDLGGTKTEVAVLDDNLHPVYRNRVATPSHDYDSILTLIADLVIDAEKISTAEAVYRYRNSWSDLASIRVA